MLGWIERASRIAVYAGGAGFIAVAVLVTLEVILRKFFLIGLSAGFEVSSYVLAVSTAWGYSFTLIKRAHVRVDAVVMLFPRRLAVWVDVLALAVLTWFAAMLVWHGHTTFSFSFAKDARAMTPLQTPLWIPQGLWLLGLGAFLVTCVALLARTAWLVTADRLSEARKMIGTFSTREEADEEVQLAVPRAAPGAGRP